MGLSIPRPLLKFWPKLWLALIVLALGGVLTFIDQRDVTLPGPVPSDAAGEPDYYLEGVQLTRFDAQGRPHQRLDTPRLVHIPETDVTRAKTPDARLLDDRGRIWFASGDTGTLGPGGNPLTLSGNAVLQAPEEGWSLDTQTLVYDANSGHAWSESEALLRQYEQRVRGERFDAWINEGRMRLTDNVHGFHPPISEERGS
nr:LPS export ABC transporter periplasmic protein LptC [uncultured Halomonas sp.]